MSSTHSPCEESACAPDYCSECELAPCQCEELTDESLSTENSDDRESSGYAPSPSQMTRVSRSKMEISPVMLSGQKGRERRERTQGTNTINSSWHSARRSLSEALKRCSEENVLPSSPDRRPPTNIVAKKVRDFFPRGNGELNPFEETQLLTGSLSGTKPKPEILMEFRLMYVWLVIVPFERSKQIMQRLGRLTESFGASGALQQRENQDVLGTKQDWTLMLSVRGPSSGQVTQVKKTLSSTNFVEVLTSPTCYDGVTGIRSIWKSRELPDPWMLKEFGLPPISIPETGIPASTLQPWML